ncbi:fibrobacter succinogenes major paralogous domain-containing protein [Fibrobacter sp. UBA4297]|uniref:fibrobacter succinogenes major paralogous domain-containing protein n=1 Tax=Fibrobacter sp. UBA4297 TaxID=1946536 RepID=UPI0025C49621|nr:fibrobacter succinogenes major paralogous domain-containing protein [Fibrobacter sp. UBA4297]
MKNFILFVLLLMAASFAGESCKNTYQRYVKLVPDQETIDCWLTNEKEGNVKGFFFNLKGGTPGALVYDNSAPVLGHKWLKLYKGEDIRKKGVKCYLAYRPDNTFMTSKQIVSKLLGILKCEKGFSAHLGKSFTPNEGVLTDSRDGKEYKTVQIGQQVWMAENLNYKAKGSMCPDNNPSNCTKYGRLYDWSMAKRSCPAGWHLPNTDEIETLVNLLGGKSVARKILKIANDCDDYDCGSDDFGFAVLPAGTFSSSNEKFRDIDIQPYFWTAKESRNSFKDGLYWDLSNLSGNFSDSDKDDGMSVRCLRNELSEKNNIHEEDSDNEKEKIVVSSQKGMMLDPRDNQKYKTVTIGTQTWMAENIRYKTASSICYGNTSSDCAKYGRYYTFGDAYNVCPSGWHLPSAKEFAVLLKSIGGESKAGGKLKSQNDWNVNNNKCNGTDDYGFAALPTGMMMNEYESFGKGRESYFWSETDERPNSIYVLKIHCDTESATVGWTVEPDYGIPVRCIKD